MNVDGVTNHSLNSHLCVILIFYHLIMGNDYGN
jgi:hypothetical protein